MNHWLVSHPLLLRLIFSRTFWHLANHAAKRPAKSRWTSKAASRAPKQNIAVRSLRCADLDATRTYYGAGVGPVASVAKVAALAVGNCVVEKN